MWTLCWAQETHQVTLVSWKRTQILIVESVWLATRLLWELKCTQDPIPAPSVKAKKSVTEVVDRAPCVLIWELWWLLERAPMEGLKRVLNLWIGQLFSMLQKIKIETHSSRDKNIQANWWVLCTHLWKDGRPISEGDKLLNNRENEWWLILPVWGLERDSINGKMLETVAVILCATTKQGKSFKVNCQDMSQSAQGGDKSRRTYQSLWSVLKCMSFVQGPVEMSHSG